MINPSLSNFFFIDLYLKSNIMKNETLIPIRFIVIFLSIILFITFTGCWGAILEAVQHFISFCIFIVFVGGVSYLIYKASKLFGRK